MNKKFFRHCICFLPFILCFCLYSSAQNVPEASWSEQTYDFGKLTRSFSSASVSHTFKLTNTGKAKLSIVHYSFGCGCLSADIPKTVISPGESVTIDVKLDYSAISVGPFKKSVNFTMNTPQKYYSIYLTGQVCSSSASSGNSTEADTRHSDTNASSVNKSLFQKVKDFFHKR